MFNKMTKTSKQTVLFFESHFVYFRLLDKANPTIEICFSLHTLKYVVIRLTRKAISLKTSLRNLIVDKLMRDNRNFSNKAERPRTINKTVSSIMLSL